MAIDVCLDLVLGCSCRDCGIRVGLVIERGLRCSVRDCGVTGAGAEGKTLGADRIDLESKFSADLDNFPMVVLGSSRIGLIGEFGVLPARSGEGYMV